MWNELCRVDCSPLSMYSLREYLRPFFYIIPLAVLFMELITSPPAVSMIGHVTLASGCSVMVIVPVWLSPSRPSLCQGMRLRCRQWQIGYFSIDHQS